MNEKTRVVAFSGTVSEYLPLMSVDVPRVVPLTNTDTPGIVPSPSVAEVTVPVMTFVCAHRVLAPANTNKTKNRNSFFIRLRFRLKFELGKVEKKYFLTMSFEKKSHITL
jgi:hypothetical protein